MTDPHPPSDFDDWAERYDRTVHDSSTFPFDGYERVLDTVVARAESSPGQSVLDLGTGTGNLALRFARLDRELWCTDFSRPMLEEARRKLPSARFSLHDLRGPWPDELDRRFDRIVSAYVFHHFELPRKVEIIGSLVERGLAAGGRIAIADLSFPDRVTMHAFARSAGDLWEEESYWLADEALAAMEDAGRVLECSQVSSCAGVRALYPGGS